MKKSLLGLCAAALIIMPAAVEAQGFALAGRAGTLGIGAEAALGLGPNLAIRGGLGLLPVERDAGSFWDACKDDSVECTIKLPKNWYNVGLDLYLGGGFRIGGGMLFKPDDPTITGELTGTASIEIGGTTYTATEVAMVSGSVDSKSQAPYAIIGFGHHTKSGVGLFLDLGMAFLGDSPVVLSATGNQTVVGSTEFQSRLRAEEASLEEDLPTWARKYWPILNVGLKVGIGG
jgi:hypothetical protein